MIARRRQNLRRGNEKRRFPVGKRREWAVPQTLQTFNPFLALILNIHAVKELDQQGRATGERVWSTAMSVGNLDKAGWQETARGGRNLSRAQQACVKRVAP